MEDELSSQWSDCLDGKAKAFRITAAFHRVVRLAAREFQADLILLDVGPNLGALNRCALIAADHVELRHYPSLMPMAMEARKPIFNLKPADGAIGAHAAAVAECGKDFARLARRLADATGLALPAHL